jgi:2-amino-4-hydroxy-6-hydroxymethyldihydropteridine diphosphokinase
VKILKQNDLVQLDEAIVVALGSNLAGEFASREALLEAALSELPRAGMRIARRSSWWRSAAWPDPKAPDYLNGVVIVETELTPRQVLDAGLALEAHFGRKRGKQNAPRTLDIDLIAHGRMIITQPDLVVPHPRAHERLFVMGPLAQIAPDWRHPTLVRTAAELAAKAPVGRDAEPI